MPYLSTSSQSLTAKSQVTGQQEPLRILAVGETWFGSDARSAFSALRRLGQIVQVIDENNYLPNTWRHPVTKGLRKLLRPLFVSELTSETIDQAAGFRPHCLLVFKGNCIHPKVLLELRRRGVTTLNFYPDVSFLSHGPYIPKALPLYDHIFSTKTYGLADMRLALNVKSSSFLPPSFDPEVHYPIRLTVAEQSVFACDVAFIGTWSTKKESVLHSLVKLLPELRLRIWGNGWDNCRSIELQKSIMGRGVTGAEYSRAICGAQICLGLLSEAGRGSSSGDLITSRTFQIPACGTFMLHERNAEVLTYFAEGRDAEFFDSPNELAEKVRFYLSNHRSRIEIAKNGRDRSLKDDYSVDARMKSLVEWLDHRIRNSREGL